MLRPDYKPGMEGELEGGSLVGLPVSSTHKCYAVWRKCKLQSDGAHTPEAVGAHRPFRALCPA
eukprot:2893837-Alexandrium_andersonii.AAC.1